MRLNEYFDKIFCINLDKRIDKWLLSKKEFQKHDLIVDRFIAIEGNPDKIKTHLTDGGVGCTISHLEVFKLSKLLNLKNVLILEDDVEFIDDLNDRFNEYYKQIHENWGLLYLGGNHNGMPIQKISENMAMITNTISSFLISTPFPFLPLFGLMAEEFYFPCRSVPCVHTILYLLICSRSKLRMPVSSANLFSI